jgi:hypothetical protein
MQKVAGSHRHAQVGVLHHNVVLISKEGIGILELYIIAKDKYSFV